MEKNKLCIIVPCFNEEDVLQLSNDVLLKTLENLISIKMVDTESFILYVDDGSTDKTWNIISKLHKNDTRHRLRDIVPLIGYKFSNVYYNVNPVKAVLQISITQNGKLCCQ